MSYVPPIAPERNPAAQGPEIGDVAGLPVGFDPQRFPIISRHILGIDPTGPIGRAAAELLAEVAVEPGLEDAIRKKLRRYLDIPDEALDLTGGRRLPPSPIHEVLS